MKRRNFSGCKFRTSGVHPLKV